MPEIHIELLQIADELEQAATVGRDADILTVVDALKKSTRQAERAFSGSWQGYHAYVYYKDLQPIPPGRHFSQEWGIGDMSSSGLGSTGEWQEFDPEKVKSHVRNLAGDPNMAPALKFLSDAVQIVDQKKSDILSILTTVLSTKSDSYLLNLKEEIETLEIISTVEIAERLRPKGQFMTRDTIVFGQGTRIPPHVSILCEAAALEQAIEIESRLAVLARKAGSHLVRQNKQIKKAALIGTNVFIGHGRSQQWRELKDFVEDRLSLPIDEFNRVPVAGVTNIARLSEMLDAAAVALLVMTGEDEQNDGRLHARMNVIHEAGLFQGRLGFNCAIVVLEDGCDAFSNVEGLGQIRFPKGNIKAAFEEVRLVLEREGLLTS